MYSLSVNEWKTSFVRHISLAKTLGGQIFLKWKTALSTRVRMKFVNIFIQKSDIDCLSLSKERQDSEIFTPIK